MLEITGNDIADLNDTDLRTLIGLLCEAELNSLGLPIAGVTWGGHQNASDGGVDVRVDVDTLPQIDGYIPRANTAFQVKKPDMPRAAIKKEMRPKGVLQKFFSELAESNGAYIIVSSQGSTADSALRDRKKAMQDALHGLTGASNIKVDFYDRERVAGWVRSHPAMILWVRSKLGRSIQGWKPYGNWANCPNGIDEEYLCDDQVRLFDHSSVQEGMSGVQGLNALRNSLSVAASSVRLTGLSGVGKTRLLQAMFDERIGDNPLNQSQVFYTDISDSPNPSPTTFLEQLISLKKPAVIVIDNCPPELHRRLTSLNSGVQSLVSLITVEYDVREDQPEETEVFHLEPSSDELIEKVIRARFPYVNQVDAGTIAKFSGGNARVAIALASTVEKGESLSNLQDNDLFERLFHQRNRQDNELLNAAEVCSLVYSFECDTDDGSDLELQRLSRVGEMTVRQLYGHISELKRRDLIQQRSVWRAVLPQALANRLAKRALENIPYADISLAFERGDSERLLKSFSRRLGYLHDSQEAKKIASKWLSDGGLLGNVSNLNSLEIELFKNIAPIEPEMTLYAIEKAAKSDTATKFLSTENPIYYEFTHLLRLLAYDKELFERSVNLLIPFVLSEQSDENTNSTQEMFETLFYIFLSGTHASPEQRLEVISKLIQSEDEQNVSLAFRCLEAALESFYFNSHYAFDFGARHRDHGFDPTTLDEQYQWYKLFIEFTVECASTVEKYASNAKNIISEQFRGLWINTGMYDELENAVIKLSHKNFWGEGWVAVKSTIKYDGERMSDTLVSRLNNLAGMIGPKSLEDRIRLYALSYSNTYFSLEDTEEENSDQDVVAVAKLLGQEVTNDISVLHELLEDLLTSDCVRTYNFGEGIADSCQDPLTMWDTFKQKLAYIGRERVVYGLLQGFLNALEVKNPTLLNKLLDDALDDDILASTFPRLQMSVRLDKRAVDRLIASLKHGKASVKQYANLAYGQLHKTISDDDLCMILGLVLNYDDGMLISLEILNMRFHRTREREAIPNEQLITFCQELLVNIEFPDQRFKDGRADRYFARIFEVCFYNEEASLLAKIFCRKILQAIAKIHPIVFLDCLLEESYHSKYMGFGERGRGSRGIDMIDNEVIIKWCNVNPDIRNIYIATVIKPYEQIEKELMWTPLAKYMILSSLEPSKILDEFKKIFKLGILRGSLTDTIQKYLPLIANLKVHELKEVSDWAKETESELQKQIMETRIRERNEEIEENERFE
ncbi:hypothetical protein [Sulfurovum sp.]|uniref:hypothetical protein n=1 Tax=Sulfurovum sp. TaxID=1969726 RepID=UPI003567E9D2